MEGKQINRFYGLYGAPEYKLHPLNFKENKWFYIYKADRTISHNCPHCKMRNVHIKIL